MAVDIANQAPFDLLYQAIRSTQYRVTHLEFGHAVFGVPLSLFEPFKGNTAFSNLRILYLAIEPTSKEMRAVEEARPEGLTTILRNFSSFFRECYSLEELALMRANYNQSPVTSASIFRGLVASSVSDTASRSEISALTKLETVSLEGFGFLWQDLADLVATTRFSLKSLTVTLFQACRGNAVPEPAEAVRQLRILHGGDDLELHGTIFGEVDGSSDGLFD